MKRNEIIVISGPTAVGKTELSLKIARKTGGEIISADSMQVYRGMDVGTAKITKEEMGSIPHHLIDIREPDEDYSAADFQREASEAVRKIISKGKIPIVTGGTGLYIRALTDSGFSFPAEKHDTAARKNLWAEYEQNGPEALYASLRIFDPAAASRIHRNDVKRVIRALEYFYQTGKKFSGQKDRTTGEEYTYHGFFLNRERSALYERINRRTEQMLAVGLVEETVELRKKGVPVSAKSMQGIGYRQANLYIDGKINYEEMVREIKKSTRNFAKRQITWFRNSSGFTELNLDILSDEETEKIILSRLNGDIIRNNKLNDKKN